MDSREQQAGLQPPAQADQAQGPACQECGKAVAKYCCPRCDRRTCSLDCVKGALLLLDRGAPCCCPCPVGITSASVCVVLPGRAKHSARSHMHTTAAAAHKEATGCSGKRDRTAFVGRAAFDERTFLSDYRFLEEASGVR